MDHLKGCQNCGCKVVFDKESDKVKCTYENCDFEVEFEEMLERAPLDLDKERFKHWLITGES